jgi:accessory gene regulator B
MLGKQLEEDEDRTDILAYGLEIIIGGTVKSLLVIFLAYILGIFQTVLISVLSFVAFRHFGGGVHLSTYPRCLSIGLLLFLGLGKLAELNMSANIITLLMGLTLILGAYVIIRWVPAGTHNKNVSDEALRLGQKKKMAIVLIGWTIITSILIQHQLRYGLALILGAVSSFFFITPWGYRVLHTLDHIFNTVKEGRKKDD